MSPPLEDSLEAARELLGDRLVVGETAGTIVETEAYLGDGDPGSHASSGRTERNAPMYASAGTIYVYRSYGIHDLVNIVTGTEGSPEAVLIRALRPETGIDRMRERRGREAITELCDGPGKLTEALDIDLDDNQTQLGDRIRLREGPTPEHERTGRIGLSAGEELPYRFVVTDSEYSSR